MKKHKRPLINTDIFAEFVRSGQFGGILLLACVALSLIIANTGAGPGFAEFLQKQIGFESANIHLRYSLSLWINDGLMAVFFLLVGLEIKRELIEGELSSPKRAALPVFAALGGMLAPALIFALFNTGTVSSSGWGIPMATDIAFALAIVGLLGKKVPASLKIFLAALAIADDLGAILVIAVFYTAELHTSQLLYAGGIFGLLILLNKLGVRNLFFYLVPGLFLWYFVHHSGIHATIAGVLLAFTIPTNPVKELSPLETLEHTLSKPVNFLIMPLFALANTNIRFEPEMLGGLFSPLGLGILLGLFAGKTIGVSLFSWLAVRLKMASLPHAANWKHIIGLGMLAGIGFTMSIFIALLSFSDTLLQNEAKFSILTASLLSGLLGFMYLTAIRKKTTHGSDQAIGRTGPGHKTEAP